MLHAIFDVEVYKHGGHCTPTTEKVMRELETITHGQKAEWNVRVFSYWRWQEAAGR